MFTKKERNTISGAIRKYTNSIAKNNKSYAQDLFQEGWVKVMELYPLYDKERGPKFLSYAGPFIRLHMIAKLAEWTHLYAIPKNIRDVKPSIIAKYNGKDLQNLSKNERIKYLVVNYGVLEEDVKACIATPTETYNEEDATVGENINFEALTDQTILKDFLMQYRDSLDFQLFFQVKVIGQSVSLAAVSAGVSRQTAFNKIKQITEVLKQRLAKEFPEYKD